MNIPVTPIIKRRLKISCFRKVDVFCVLYSPTNPRQHIAAYISSAISLDFKKEIPNIPEKDCAFFLFCPTDRKRSAVRIYMQLSPSTAIYFNVISNVKIKISGIWNERRLAVNLFQDVPADRIPISCLLYTSLLLPALLSILFYLMPGQIMRRKVQKLQEDIM